MEWQSCLGKQFCETAGYEGGVEWDSHCNFGNQFYATAEGKGRVQWSGNRGLDCFHNHGQRNGQIRGRSRTGLTLLLLQIG